MTSLLVMGRKAVTVRCESSRNNPLVGEVVIVQFRDGKLLGIVREVMYTRSLRDSGRSTIYARVVLANPGFAHTPRWSVVEAHDVC